MKANDIICLDTNKTRIENDLDINYGNIMVYLGRIMELCGLDKNFIDKKLDNNEISQIDLDYLLMELIATIKYN